MLGDVEGAYGRRHVHRVEYCGRQLPVGALLEQHERMMPLEQTLRAVEDEALGALDVHLEIGHRKLGECIQLQGLDGLAVGRRLRRTSGFRMKTLFTMRHPGGGAFQGSWMPVSTRRMRRCRRRSPTLFLYGPVPPATPAAARIGPARAAAGCVCRGQPPRTRHAAGRPQDRCILRAASVPSGARGCSSMAERQLPKLHTRVRFPSPAPSQVAEGPVQGPSAFQGLFRPKIFWPRVCRPRVCRPRRLEPRLAGPA